MRKLSEVMKQGLKYSLKDEKTHFFRAARVVNARDIEGKCVVRLHGFKGDILVDYHHVAMGILKNSDVYIQFYTLSKDISLCPSVVFHSQYMRFHKSALYCFDENSINKTPSVNDEPKVTYDVIRVKQCLFDYGEVRECVKSFEYRQDAITYAAENCKQQSDDYLIIQLEW